MGNKWVAGMILDWEVIGDDIDQHSHRTIEILKEEGYDMPEMFHAIQAHCEGLVPGAPARESKWDFSASCCRKCDWADIRVHIDEAGQKDRRYKTKIY